jgi:hypothetical protein
MTKQSGAMTKGADLRIYMQIQNVELLTYSDRWYLKFSLEFKGLSHMIIAFVVTITEQRSAGNGLPLHSPSNGHPT